MNSRVARVLALAVACAMSLLSIVSAQTPQPFPRPPSSGQGGTQPAPQQPPPQQPPPQQPAKPTPATPREAANPNAPTEAMLGFVIYPGAQFIASYDAGRGQRFYLFGTTARFDEVVEFYRPVLKERGNLVFEEPPTHMFEVGRFRDETMAFPPGVTVKDYTWGGSKGYPNPKRPANPERFPTVVMIVPAPPAAAPQ